MMEEEAGWARDPRYEHISWLYPRIEPTEKRLFKSATCRSCGAMMTNDRPLESRCLEYEHYYDGNKGYPKTYHYCSNEECGDMCHGSPINHNTVWLYVLED